MKMENLMCKKFNVINKETGRTRSVHAIKVNKCGYPHFLIYEKKSVEMGEGKTF